MTAAQAEVYAEADRVVLMLDAADGPWTADQETALAAVTDRMQDNDIEEWRDPDWKSRWTALNRATRRRNRVAVLYFAVIAVEVRRFEHCSTVSMILRAVVP